MKVFVKGEGETELTQRHYVASGGQASVYVKDGLAYKIYTDPKEMIPEAKFQALATIKDPQVIKPDKILLDSRKAPTGYTMLAIPDNYSLCQLFTKAFRDRNNVTNDHIIDVVAKLRGHISNVHAANIIVVDLNELNILVNKSFDKTYMIDVDSYQTAGYPASVIMPSVRDYSVRAADFSPLSDWFSFSVLAFQLFVGVHPYKGTHPGSANIPKDGRMIHRMKQHISAFSPEVSLPACCYPLDVIPSNFRQWMKAVLQDGKRLPPPDPKSVGVVIVAQQVAAPFVSGGNIVISEFMDLDGWALVSYAESNGSSIALTTKGGKQRTLVNGKVVAEASAPPAGTAVMHVGFTHKMNRPVTLSLGVKDGKVLFIDHGLRQHDTAIFVASQLSKSGSRFYVKTGTKVLEVDFNDMPSKTLMTASHSVAGVMELASTLYEGCVIQSMLGSAYVSLFPKSRHGYQVRVPELDHYKILDAKFHGGVLMVLGAQAKTGRYDRLVFRFDPEEDYRVYDLRVVEDISASDAINFVTLDSGVCVCLNEEDKLEAFSAKKDKPGLRIIEDKALGADVRLMLVGGKAGFERGGKLYQLSLK